MKGRFSRKFSLPLRLAVTGALLAYILHAFRLDPVINNLRGITLLLPWAAVLLILVFQFSLLGCGWYRILCASRVQVGLAWAVRVVFIGLFFNQCLPTSLGGDGVRVLMLRSAKVSTGMAVNVVLVDRLSGMACLMPFLLSSIPFLFSWAGNSAPVILNLGLSFFFCVSASSAHLRRLAWRFRLRWDARHF